MLPFAEDGNPVGNVHHLVELMGDDDDGMALFLHPAQHGEELIDLLHSEHGGWLVQDDDLGPIIEHLDDLQGLLFRHGHVGHLFPGVDVKAKAPGYLSDLLIPVPAQQRPGLFRPHPDVVRSGQYIHQLKVLVDHTDAQPLGVLGGGNDGRLALHPDGAAVRRIDAGQHIHQGGLARAVFPQQRQDLSMAQVQVHVPVGHHAAKGLGDAPHFHGKSV